jgi:hypothetical protein
MNNAFVIPVDHKASALRVLHPELDQAIALGRPGSARRTRSRSNEHRAAVVDPVWRPDFGARRVVRFLQNSLT